ncbi:MAG: hypothetical protein Q7U04_07255 [Bacteriovorax sp.]|nr:hypothetical protein [Bacteriovorax sp.]
MERIFRLCGLIILVFCLSFTASAGRNIAIVVDGNDTDPDGIGEFLTNSSNQIANLLQKSSREVIRINARDGSSAKDIIKTISELKDIDKLEISLITHGVVVNPEESFVAGKKFTSLEMKNRFPLSHLRPDEVKTQYAFSKLNNDVHFSFAMFTPNGNSNDDFLGLGELHETLAKLKINNPKLKTNLTILSCFGGNAIRALKDIPDLQVFTTSSGSQLALGYPFIDLESLKKSNSDALDSTSDLCRIKLCSNNEKGISYPQFLQNSLHQGNNYLDAHIEAKKKNLAIKLNNSDFFENKNDSITKRTMLSIPQSSLEILFGDACLGGPTLFDAKKCEYHEDTQIYGKLSADTTSLLLFEYLSKAKQVEKAYFETLKKSHSCGFFQKHSDEVVLKEAFDDVIKDLRKKAEFFSQDDLNKEINGMKNIIINVNEAKTIEKIFENINQTSLLREKNYELQKQLVSLKNTNKDLESYKQEIVSVLEKKLKDATAPNALKNFSKSFNLLADEWNGIKKSPNQMNDGLTILIPTSPILLKQPSKMVDARDPEIFILDKCSKSKYFESKGFEGKDVTSLQVECIQDEARNDPYLKLFALARILYKPESEDERKKICEMFDTALETNKKIISCVSKSSVKDEMVLRKLQSLFLQGLEKNKD